MTINYQITANDEFSGLTAVIDGEPYTVSGTHPAYTEIVGLLLDKVDDAKRIIGLINPAVKAGASLTALSERVSLRGTTIYFDGDPLDAVIATHIVKIFQEGGDEKAWKPLVNFLEKVSTNPSKKSRQHLYHFVEEHGMTLTESGDLVAFKGVNHDGTSVHAGYGIVDGKVYGSVDEEGNLVNAARLPNAVGSIVSIPRGMVDSDRGVACSTGLHVGTHAYASTFASHLLRVVVNPRDVVSVPSDSSNSKIRVSRYEVVAADDVQNYTSTTFYDEEEDDFLEEETDDYQDEFEVSDLESDYEDAFDEEEEDETELSDEQIVFNRHVEEFEKLIPTLDPAKIRFHRNKKVTAGRRLAYDKAFKNLGL